MFLLVLLLGLSLSTITTASPAGKDNKTPLKPDQSNDADIPPADTNSPSSSADISSEAADTPPVGTTSPSSSEAEDTPPDNAAAPTFSGSEYLPILTEIQVDLHDEEPALGGWKRYMDEHSINKDSFETQLRNYQHFVRQQISSIQGQYTDYQKDLAKLFIVHLNGIDYGEPFDINASIASVLASAPAGQYTADSVFQHLQSFREEIAKDIDKVNEKDSKDK
nr:CP52k-like protein 9 [Membranobalanus longirostrum]